LGKLAKKLFSRETVEQAIDSGTEVADKTFKLAEVLQKPDIQKLGNVVAQGASLLDVLNSPLGELVETTVPFAKVATSLFKFYLTVSREKPTLADSVVLVSQIAYLESVKATLEKLQAAKPVLYQQLLERQGQRSASQQVQANLKALGGVELNTSEAMRALVSFQESELATQFNAVLSLRLQDWGWKPESANQLAKKVASETHLYVRSAVAELGESAERLKHWYQLGEQALFEKQFSIEDYLHREIRSQPDVPIFDEKNISLRDLYVPLKIRLLDQNGQILEEKEPINLQDWVRTMLDDPEKQRQILFLQGGAGQGKSVFCRMFADALSRSLTTTFTPILIRLRELTTLANNLTGTLTNHLQNHAFVSSDSGWLTDRQTTFLFLLDGFDELLLEGRDGRLKDFLQQVEHFQKTSHHRFIVTGRPLALQGVDRLITQDPCLERASLELMDDEIRDRWLAKWEAKVGADERQAFQAFLHSCPDDVKNKLAREPLLLYLLARLHREQQLSVDSLAGTEATATKVKIYDQAVQWVLEKQRQSENERLTRLSSLQLRQFFREIAVCVVQSGHELATLAMLEKRLESNPDLKSLLQQSKENQEKAGVEFTDKSDRPLNNLLTAFYLKPATDRLTGSVEFAHKSFGEFLFAERLKEALEDWAETTQDRYGQIQNRTLDSDLQWQVYDLLGYGGLTPEIMDYVMVMLDQSQLLGNPKPPAPQPASPSPAADPQPFIHLFRRLQQVYFQWSDGVFIDEVGNNLPQKKMQLMNEQLQAIAPDTRFGLRQVDVFTGLNLLILLFSMHRYAQRRDDLQAQIHFHPCGQPDTDEFDNQRLLRAIGYSNCVAVGTFTATVRRFLSRADLSGADLRDANLISADLSGAFFFCADLSDADLSGADLRDANLISADLSGAFFFRADLSGANLSGANLSDANLSDANLRGANFEAVQWDNKTKWERVRGWETIKNLPEALRQWLEEMQRRQQAGEMGENAQQG
jgi:hypothetical protein